MPIVKAISVLAPLAAIFGCAGTNTAARPDASAATQLNSACLKDTGSRIVGDMGCSAFGRSYSSDDMYRTGAPTVAGSLRQLDPSVTVSGRN